MGREDCLYCDVLASVDKQQVEIIFCHLSLFSQNMSELNTKNTCMESERTCLHSLEGLTQETGSSLALKHTAVYNGWVFGFGLVPGYIFALLQKPKLILESAHKD